MHDLCGVNIIQMYVM